MTCIFLAAKNVEFVPYRNLLKTMMSRIYASPVPKVCGRGAKRICGLLLFSRMASSRPQGPAQRVIAAGSNLGDGTLAPGLWDWQQCAMLVVNLLRKCGRLGHQLGCGPELLGFVLQEWVSELELECLDALEWRLGPFFRHTV